MTTSKELSNYFTNADRKRLDMTEKEAVKTLQLPISVHEDLKNLADKEASKLNINHLSKVGYLRRLIAREKARA